MMLYLVSSKETQNPLKRTLSRPESIEYVNSILAADDDINRTKLADQLCEHFMFFDLRGERQRSGCLKALRELEKAGHFILPQPVYKGKQSVLIWVVHIEEVDPPIDTKPLEWFLLTTIDIKTIVDALKWLERYCLRWCIEDRHRVLKSGCGVEKLAHKTADRLRRAMKKRQIPQVV